MTRELKPLALAGLGAAAAALFASPAFAAALACDKAAIQAVAPGATIVSATPTAAPAPHCRVDGFVITTNPGPNQVNFRLQLPDQDWNGRYYFIGMGGSAGFVPNDSQIPPGNPIVKGFAVAGTDTGRQGSSGDWDFVGESPVKALDHKDRGAHVTAVATQAITRAYYAAPKIYRYMAGCSGGGRMSTEAIENHPEDFDGVVLGATGAGAVSGGTMLKFIDSYHQATREPGAWLSPAKLKLIEKNVTAACDATDGAVDGVVSDKRLCHFKVETLQCKGADGSECLTRPEIRTVNALLVGPVDSKGRRLTQGWPLTNTSLWAQFLGNTPPPWSTEMTHENAMKASSAYTMGSSMGRVYMGKAFRAEDFHSENPKDLAAWIANAKRVNFGVPFSANLKGFQTAGGKVLMYDGRSDPCCSDLDMEQYYLDAAKSIGAGIPELQKFARFYPIGGMGHCGSGTGPNDVPDRFLDAMIDWVEKGVAPEGIVAHGGARARLQFADPKTGVVSGVLIPPAVGPDRDFLECPYPKVPTYDPKASAKPGAVYEAANWACALPKAPRKS